LGLVPVRRRGRDPAADAGGRLLDRGEDPEPRRSPPQRRGSGLVRADVLSALRTGEAGAAGRRWALRWREPALVAALGVYLWFTYYVAHGTLYLQGLVLVAAVFAILAVSLDLVAGMVGLYSLGHAGLFALGAYGTTILYNDHHWNLFALLPASM